MHRIRLALLVLLAASGVAQEPSRALLRQAIAADPLRLHLVAAGRVRVGGLVVDENTFLEERGAVAQGALVVVTSDSAIRWERDTDLRQALLATGRPRDVIFVRAERAAAMLEEQGFVIAPELEARIVGWVERLGSPVWAERQQASRVLAEFGRNVLPVLRRTQGGVDDLEIRWRLDRVVADLTGRMVLEPGFLGIAYHYQAFDLETRPEMPEGAIAIQQVLVGTQAQRAGLRAGDLVYAINEKPLANDSGTSKVTKIFAGLRAGEPITLNVLRDDREVYLEARMGAYRD